MLSIDFYFDFISPFAYLANGQLPELARRYGAQLDYRPIDIMLAKISTGNFAPSTRAIPAKARYIRADRLGWAQRTGMPMRDPAKLRAPRLNRGVLLAIERGRAREYVDAAFDEVWGRGGDPDDDALITRVALRLDWDPQSLLAYMDSPPAHAGYAASRREAHGRGVFGAPTMMVGDEMFWGNDRLDFLEEYLASNA